MFKYLKIPQKVKQKELAAMVKLICHILNKNCLNGKLKTLKEIKCYA